MVAVLSSTGKRLMPTTEYRARKLLKSRRASIKGYKPVFTIILTNREDGDTQPVEYSCDTGYRNIGVSIKSEKHEYVNAQYDLLTDETEHHNDQRKYRRSRRNHKTRYRKPRFDNRKGLIAKDGFAPSIRNKRDQHIMLCQSYCEVIPVTDITFELGNFDTQVLKAIEEGKPLPQGRDYQQGEQYGYATLREAVFSRDDYTCQVCGKSSIKDGVIVRMHHIGFWKGDRTNRMSNLLTVCCKCHNSRNHKPGGKLYGLQPRLKQFRGATFMTSVRWDMLKRLKKAFPNTRIHVTYGAATKLARKELGVKKSHSNDAYCMGEFYPTWRTDFKHYKKCRRNNRILSKFYDAVFVDIRDGSKKKGSQLSCGRTNRSTSRNSELNERIYRGQKVSKGRLAVRRQRYGYRPGDFLWTSGQRYIVKGVISCGTRIALNERLPVSVNKVDRVVHAGGWVLVS